MHEPPLPAPTGETRPPTSLPNSPPPLDAEPEYLAKPLSYFIKRGIAAPASTLVPRLVIAGRTTLCAGPPKLGKTTCWCAVSAALSAGRHPWGDEPTQAGTVVWISLEEHEEDLTRRFAAMDPDPDRIFVATTLRHPGGPMAAIRANIDRHQPVLLVIDTLGALANSSEAVPDENNATAMCALVQAVTDLAHATGVAVVLLHHARKDGSGYRGSSAIAAAVDVVVEMTGVDGAPEMRRFTATGRAQAACGVTVVQYDPERQRFTEVDPAQAPAESEKGGRGAGAAEIRGRLLQFFTELGDREASREEVRQAGGARHTSVDEVLATLITEGVVVRLGPANRYRYRLPSPPTRAAVA